MKPEDLTISLAPTAPWHALDEGVSFLKHHLVLILPTWLLTVTVAGFLSSLLLTVNLPLAMIVFWWLKPLYDRVLLYMMSRRLFSENISALETFRDVKSWLFGTGLIKDLTIYRLSLMRSFLLPVKQLEKIPSKLYAGRTSVLRRKAGRPATMLTVLGVHLEAVVNMTVSSMIFMLIPEESGLMDLLFEDTEIAYQLYLLSVYIVTVAVIEPFYMASGLFLYLKRRINLEGWDIELAFKKLAGRYS